jgi:hypothetical protein
MVFKPTFSLENVMKYTCIAESSLYIQGHHPKKTIFYLVEYTWHILESNFTLQKVDFKNYLHLGKSTWNLFLQCKILKLMHNNEETSCSLSFN